MENNSLKPHIRFKGFTEAWEQRELKKLIRKPVTDGPHETPNLLSDGIPFISVEAIHDGIIDLSKCRGFISEEDDIRFKTKYTPEMGDVFFTKAATIGRVAVVDEPNFNIWSPIGAIKPDNNKLLSRYLFHVLQTTKIQNEAILSSNNGSQFNLGMDKIEAFIIPLPKQINEQYEISVFLNEVNELITLHQRKYEKLTHIKKSLLEKMFPADGHNIPKIRFKGFTEAWEQRELGKEGTTYTGLSGKTKDDFGHGNGTFVTYMNVFKNPIANPSMIEPIDIDSSQREIKYGDIFFTTSSETPDEVGMSSIWMEKVANTYLNSFCFGYRLNELEKYDLSFLAYNFRANTFRKDIVLLAQGISRYNISKNKVMEIQTFVPINKNEQCSIGGFLVKIDSLITLHQRKYEMLKNIKKSLLEKMFV